MVIYLQRGADLHMAQLMPLPLTVYCSSKIQIGFTLLVPAYPGCSGKEAVKWLFFLHFTYLGLRMHPTRPPTYGPDVSKALKFRQNIDILFRRHVAITSIQLPPYYT